MRRLLPMLAVAALIAAAPAAAFVPTDPLASKQWYLYEDHAFDAWPTPPTTLAPVKVAVVDSGIDATLPDFAGRIAAAQSFVGGSPLVDTEGHGTFVAGEIAANLDSQGIVGMAYSAQLLIAKVVTPDGRIPLDAEAEAIRWAVDNGARVINLSLGGVRDPANLNRDTYSAIEASAVAYAYAKGAVLVAAVGNADEAYAQPWPYASYPAALPHVIGVSALTRSGNVADFSDRDAVFNDIAAPGAGIFSTFPAALTELRPTCTDQGYSDCGPDDYANAEGTSFSTPQVTRGGRDALRGRSHADEQPGRRDPRAHRRRRQRVDRLREVRGADATRTRAGAVSTSRRRSRQSRQGRCRRRTRTRRTTTRAPRRGRSGASRGSSTRRSTTTTTRWTSIGCRSPATRS